MLKQIGIDNVPKPVMSSSLEQKRLNFTGYLSKFEKISPIDAINFENTIQVIVALLYSYNNPDIPAFISFPRGSTDIEILNTPLVQMIPSVFKNYQFVINSNNIIELFVKEILSETKEAFSILKKEKKIDPCIDKLIRNYDNKKSKPINIKAFEIITNGGLHNSINLSKILYNKFFMYLMSQSLRYNGYFGIVLPSWSKEEIQNENYFMILTNLFKRVCVVGSGEEWESTHLIVSEPYEDVVSCIQVKNHP